MLGEEHPDTLISNGKNLASTYRNQGSGKEARRAGGSSVQHAQKHPGGIVLNTLTSMANLASNTRTKGGGRSRRPGGSIMQMRKKNIP